MSLGVAMDPAGRPRKPGALCIGAQKAGTSWLAQMLGQHPQVWIPPFKEVQYFNHLFIPGHRRWIGWHYRQKFQEIRDRHARAGQPVPPGLDAYLHDVTRGKMFHNQWYKRVFAPAPPDAVPMDLTPEYSTLPDEGVDHVAGFLPGVRVIYLIRHPVDRALSQLGMNLHREGRRPATLADWMAEIDNPVLYERGDYAAYLPRWQARFPDLLVLPFGRIARDPQAVMDAVGSHLGLGPWSYANLTDKVFAARHPLSVPPQAIAALEARIAPQLAFLADHLGADFATETR